MRLLLTYSGELRPSQAGTAGRPDKLSDHKMRIRRHFHPQIRSFFQKNRFLSSYKADSIEYGSLSPLEASGHWNDGPSVKAKPLVALISENFEENGFSFCPLVCEWMHLACSIDVLMLRRGYPPFGIINQGDLDNRVKTLIDCLCKPNGLSQMGTDIAPHKGETPFFCLLEDDKLLDGLAVKSETLLRPKRESEGEPHVEAIITVEIRPFHITGFNLGFA